MSHPISARIVHAVTSSTVGIVHSPATNIAVRCQGRSNPFFQMAHLPFAMLQIFQQFPQQESEMRIRLTFQRFFQLFLLVLQRPHRQFRQPLRVKAARRR